MQKKSGIVKSGLDAMPFFLLDELLTVQKKSSLMHIIFWKSGLPKTKIFPCLILGCGHFPKIIVWLVYLKTEEKINFKFEMINKNVIAITF